MAIGLIAIPDDMTFTAEEARSLVNYKVEELEQVMEERIDDYRKRNVVDKFLSDFSPREQKVLKYRFGFLENDDELHTLEEVAKRFGITRERVRQIETKAMERLGDEKELLRFQWNFDHYRCLCGKYRKKRYAYAGIICEKCGIEVQDSRKIIEKVKNN